MSQDAGVTGNTELGANKADIIAELVQRELKPLAILLKTIMDVSAFAKKGMASCSFPKTGSLAVQNRPTGEKVANQLLTFGNDKLDFDYRAYVSWLIDSADEYQATSDIQAAYISRAGTAHGRNIDAQIISVLDAAAGYVQAAGISKNKIISARKWLIKNQADPSSVTILLCADDEALIYDIPEFTEASKFGVAVLPSGVIGKILGMNVMVHTDPTLTKSWIYAKEAIAFGLQKAPAYGEEPAIGYGVGSKIAAVDQLYGFKAMRLTEGLDIDGVALGSGKSPFIAEISA